MCAILDNSVRSMLFASQPIDAAKHFRQRVETGKLPLVVGGLLKEELSGSQRAREWLSEGERSGVVRLINDKTVDAETKILKNASLCESNDEHVIALAQVSGARLLYANDDKLEKDFGNKQLVDKPRGVLYPKDKIRGGHRKWLHEHRDICKKP